MWNYCLVDFEHFKVIWGHLKVIKGQIPNFSVFNILQQWFHKIMPGYKKNHPFLLMLLIVIIAFLSHALVLYNLISLAEIWTHMFQICFHCNCTTFCHHITPNVKAQNLGFPMVHELRVCGVGTLNSSNKALLAL